MKKGILIFILLSGFVWAFEGIAARSLLSLFSRETITVVSKSYGKNALRALETLSAKYGRNGLKILDDVYARYGSKGVEMLSKYGEEALQSKSTYAMVSRYGDRGFYLVKKYPGSVDLYSKFGDRFVDMAERFGPRRMMKYLSGSKQYGAEEKILGFLEKFGDKGNRFLDRHWGKLLASGFVLLNADSLIVSTENIGKELIHAGGDIVVKTTKGIADSQIGWFVGIAMLLLVIFKYGLDFISGVLMRFRRGDTLRGEDK